MWTGDCVRNKEGSHPTLNNLGLGTPSPHISLFLTSLSIAQPQEVLLFYPIVPRDWSPSFPFPHRSALYHMLFPNDTLELSESSGWPFHRPTSLQGESGTPFYTWAWLLFSHSCIRSIHHTFPQSMEMLYGGEFLFSTHHWGDMWVKKMMHLICSGWKHSVI